jgi:alkyl hydroperoxide reductase subunit F
MLVGQVEKNPKIEIITNTNIQQIKGKIFVDSVVLDREYKGSAELKLDGLFVEIGHIPSSLLAAELGVKLNESKEIIVDRESRTNVPGIFAAGDVTDNGWKQAIIAASQGSFAAFSAYRFVKTK